ncbi:MAG TPA: GH3 auxin-responsive promoter family protein [Bacteroidales bacterium]|nr:GH3 auxin-responsive promoter family protein [Bacteroidales bacterium]HPR13347.1 GH3 auxin-responsive promoter family protein [Bacteroidales bacterium]
MGIIPKTVKLLNTSRLNQIAHFKLHPIEVQEHTFFNLISKASDTTWGKHHNYNLIKSIADFQSAVSVQTYEDFIPWMERLRKGEKNLLWPGKIKWFAKSSGTTSSKSKFIPITEESLEKCHYRASKDVLALYTASNPNSNLFPGKALILGGSHKIDRDGDHALIGDLSAILIENTPVWFDLVRTPKKEIVLLEDFEKKLNLVTRSTINENVTSISGVPSWFLTLIKHILAYTGKKVLSEVWPNLEVFFHGGISFKPYRELYKELIGSEKMNYMETYNASEGFFGIQDDLSTDDLLLMLDYGIFYEFIPAHRAGEKNAPVYTLGEVETGVNYALVISTNSGLWRYMIGDTVVFTSVNPYKFRISGRTKHFINTFGEEVIVDNADRALEKACSETGAIISDYTAGPVFMSNNSKGSHEWLIEFEKLPSDFTKFIDILDESLKEINSDYEAKRFKDINLVRPVVRTLPNGSFKNWLKSKNKLGGQNKIPRLSNDRKIIEEMYAVAGIGDGGST